MTPAKAAKTIGGELGRTEPKGAARLAVELSKPTTQHTPGPWLAYNSDNGRPLKHWRIRGFCVRDDPTFATIDSNGKLSPEYEAANARLIAAAPELLAEVESLRKTIADALDNMPYLFPAYRKTEGLTPEAKAWREKLQTATKSARTTIAKATVQP